MSLFLERVKTLTLLGEFPSIPVSKRVVKVEVLKSRPTFVKLSKFIPRPNTGLACD